MRKLIAIIIMYMSLLPAAYSNETAHGCIVFDDGEACKVSIIQLISNPNAYNKKLIAVNGYYRYQWEMNAIFLTKEHGDFADGSNGLWISQSTNTKPIIDCDLKINSNFCSKLIPGNEANGKYVKIIGVFNKDRKGHLGIYQGTIEEVQGFVPVEKY